MFYSLKIESIMTLIRAFLCFVARGTSREVIECPDLRESSNRFGICAVKKPRSLMWFTPERLRCYKVKMFWNYKYYKIEL